MKAMKAMKVMKAKKVTVVAKGKGAKARVFSGMKAKTTGGLTKDKLMKNKNGKVVSKQASARSKKNFARSPLKAWSEAVKKARKERLHGLRRDRRQIRGGQVALRQGQVLALSSPCSSSVSRWHSTVRPSRVCHQASQGLLPWFSRGMAVAFGSLWARCTRMLRSHLGAE